MAFMQAIGDGIKNRILPSQKQINIAIDYIIRSRLNLLDSKYAPLIYNAKVTWSLRDRAGLILTLRKVLKMGGFEKNNPLYGATSSWYSDAAGEEFQSNGGAEDFKTQEEVILGPLGLDSLNRLIKRRTENSRLLIPGK